MASYVDVDDTEQCRVQLPRGTANLFRCEVDLKVRSGTKFWKCRCKSYQITMFGPMLSI